MSFPLLSGLRSNDLAIDLGTANTLVYAKGRGVVLSEPSIVAINKVTNNVEAVGKDAKEMLGRTPGNIVAIRPMRDGVIANFEVTEKMLQHFIRKAHNGRTWVSPRVVIGIPSEITQVERRAVEDSAYRAKASEVYLVEEIPQTITVTDEEVRQALDPSVCAIVDAVRVALERTPPELSADIIDRGVVLTGGGALLANLDKRLRTETGLPVFVADDPLTSVVLGAGKMLSDFALLKRVKWENTLQY